MNSPYLKAIAPALLTLVAVASLYITSGELDRAELAVGATGVIGSSLVFFTTNVPGWPFLKALVPALTGGLASLALFIENGTFDKTELNILLTALGTAVVAYFAQNKSSDTVIVNELGSAPASGTIQAGTITSNHL
jgi:hypothetical protein